MAQRDILKTRVRVWHDDDTAVDISDRVIRGPVLRADIDTADWECEMTLDNSFTWIKQDLSLDPMDQLSTHNLDGSSVYDPLLSENHEVQVDIDQGSGWEVVFQGHCGAPVRGASSINKRHSIRFAPFGIVMSLKEDDRLTKRVYKDRDLATSLLTSILGDSGKLGKLAHVVVLDDPSAQVTEYTTKEGSVWDALQAAVAPTGYILASRHHAASVAYNDGSGESTPSEGFYLTLYDPVRDKSVVDYTWTDECEQRTVDYSISDVRTKVRVAFELSNGAQRFTSFAIDDAARAKYGIPAGDGTKTHRLMQLVEGNNSPVRTLAVAEAYRDFALHDLSAPTPNMGVSLDVLWTEPILHSFVEFQFEDYTAQIGITSIEYDLSADKWGGRTTFTGAVDRVIGLRNYWLSRELTEEEKARQRQEWLEGGMTKLPTPVVQHTRRYVYQTREGNTISAMLVQWERVSAWWYGYTNVYVSFVDDKHFSSEPFTTSRNTFVTLEPLPPGVPVYVKLRHFPNANMSPQGRR